MNNDVRIRPWVNGAAVAGVVVFLGSFVVRQRVAAYGGLLVFYGALHTGIVMRWARMSGYPDARMPLLVLWVFLAEVEALALGLLAGLLGAPRQVAGAAILAMAGMPFIVLGCIDVVDWFRRR